MSICTDKHRDKQATSRQIVNHIKKIETPMHDVRDFMVDVVKQYHKADKVAHTLGLFEKKASFIDNVSWCSIVGKMDHHKETLTDSNKKHLTQLVSYLDSLVNTFDEEVIEKIQRHRDIWMRKVLLWDFTALVIALLVIAGGVYAVSGSFDSIRNFQLEYLLQRPFFYAVILISLFLSMVVFHFKIRSHVMRSMIDDLDDSLPAGMSLIKALKHNTSIYSSIFRPTPVGWGFFQKRKLTSISEKMDALQDQLGAVLLTYSDK